MQRASPMQRASHAEPSHHRPSSIHTHAAQHSLSYCPPRLSSVAIRTLSMVGYTQLGRCHVRLRGAENLERDLHRGPLASSCRISSPKPSTVCTALHYPGWTHSTPAGTNNPHPSIIIIAFTFTTSTVRLPSHPSDHHHPPLPITHHRIDPFMHVTFSARPHSPTARRPSLVFAHALPFSLPCWCVMFPGATLPQAPLACLSGRASAWGAQQVSRPRLVIGLSRDVCSIHAPSRPFVMRTIAAVRG